jgi:dolichol-phosphate mannosyltransferase
VIIIGQQIVSDWLTVESGLAFGLLLMQLPATAVLLSRLVKGASRHAPIQPSRGTPDLLASVSVVVPTLNEAERISPCLAGLSRQSYEVKEITVVDSHSKDGTPELVKAASQKDPRFRLINDEALPSGWVGRPWALHNGFMQSSEQSEWILGMDADTQPKAGLIAGLVTIANTEGYDLVSLSPQFILKYPGECWLQPALLITLLYRFESAGVDSDIAERVMANGQCFLCRRSVLAAVGGYTSARSSFCDDVTLARNIAAKGFKVGFLDGSQVLKVRMYEGALETWNEWGRSLDLKDASSKGQIWGDLWLLLSVQALPLFVVLYFSIGQSALTLLPSLLLGLNVFLLAIRWALLFAVASAYDFSTAKGSWLFWLSPLADPLAVLRIFLSANRTPTQWRGRSYSQSPS